MANSTLAQTNATGNSSFPNPAAQEIFDKATSLYMNKSSSVGTPVDNARNGSKPTLGLQGLPQAPPSAINLQLGQQNMKKKYTDFQADVDAADTFGRKHKLHNLQETGYSFVQSGDTFVQLQNK